MVGWALHKKSFEAPEPVGNLCCFGSNAVANSGKPSKVQGQTLRLPSQRSPLIDFLCNGR